MMVTLLGGTASDCASARWMDACKSLAPAATAREHSPLTVIWGLVGSGFSRTTTGTADSCL